jgi:DNA-binding transcriptional LysR family regulator
VALAAQAFFRAVGDIAASVAGANERVTLGASQSILRWQLLPRLTEISGATEKFVLEMRTFNTDETVRALHDGTIDVAVAREDALAESDPKLDGGILEYRLVVARRLLPGKSAAGFQLLQTIPFGILAGEGQLVKQIQALAKEGGWEINVRLRAENFTLLFEALEHVDLAVFLPRPAAEALSKERYAIVELPHMEKLSRRLVVAFNSQAAEFRESVRKVAQRVSRILSQQASGT